MIQKCHAYPGVDAMVVGKRHKPTLKELGLRIGDIVTIVRREGNPWPEGNSARTGAIICKVKNHNGKGEESKEIRFMPDDLMVYS